MHGHIADIEVISDNGPVTPDSQRFILQDFAQEDADDALKCMCFLQWSIGIGDAQDGVIQP